MPAVVQGMSSHTTVLPFYSIDVYSASNSPCLFRSQLRLFSGFLTAVVSGFLTFTFLEPLFFPVGLEVAIVALYILSINAAFVGMSLGVLLPLICPGLCFGVAVSLFAGCLITMSSPLYFPVASAALGVVGAVLSARYVPYEVCRCVCLLSKLANAESFTAGVSA